MPRESYIVPTWPAPASVRAYSTTRLGGVSQGPYSGFNLGLHVGDDAHAVEANRSHLKKMLDLTNEPAWLSQVHGVNVLSLDGSDSNTILADGSVASKPNKICTIMTADCLPVLLCDQRGSCVAALHAGWRGLAAGILEEGVRAMSAIPADLMAWLGPAISSGKYEVGNEVREAFLNKDPNAEKGFKASEKSGHWYLDLNFIARQRLQAVGVHVIYGGDICTYKDDRFFSYRRDGVTGRMASLISLV
jgi:hypothetical protein